MIAHEQSPAITTLSATEQGHIQAVILLDLEAAMAGIARSHDIAPDERATERYKSLRLLPPKALESTFRANMNQLLTQFRLYRQGQQQSYAFELTNIEIPNLIETSAPRHSRLTLIANAKVADAPFVWQLDPSLGDSILRIRDPDSGAVMQATMLGPGEAAKPFSLQKLTEGI